MLEYTTVAVTSPPTKSKDFTCKYMILQTRGAVSCEINSRESLCMFYIWIKSQ